LTLVALLAAVLVPVALRLLSPTPLK